MALTFQPPPFAPDLFKDLHLTGFEDDNTAAVLHVLHYLKKSKMPSLVPLLPMLFSVRGEPLTLKDHFVFEPIFRTTMPKELTLITGRQVGKCRALTDESCCYADNGHPLYPEDLQIGTDLLGVDDEFRVTTNRVIAKHQNPPEAVYRVKTRLGGDFKLTTDHQLRTLYGYTAVRDLTVGSRVAGLRRGGSFGQRRVQRERIILTAYMIGDGCCVSSVDNWSFTSATPETMEEFSILNAQLQGHRTSSKFKQNNAARSFTVSKLSPLYRWFRRDGLAGKYSYEKRCPGWVFDLSKKDTALFLSRLWSTDGSIKRYEKRLSFVYDTTSRKLARDVRALLMKFEIPASVKRKKASYRSKKTGKLVRCRDVYTVRVETQEGRRRFAQAFRVPGKPIPLAAYRSENNNRDTVPIEIRELIAEIGLTLSGSRKPHPLSKSGLRLKPKYPPTFRKLREYVEHFESYCPQHPKLPALRDILDGDVLWDEIESIEFAGVEPTWDVETNGSHNYVLDGVVSHNSTVLAILKILLSVAIPYFDSLFVTPLFEQVRRFSTNYIKPFIEESPMRNLWSTPSLSSNVLQRSFPNHSRMIFSFAFNDANRVRGISATGSLELDELQGFDPSLLGIIREVLSAARRWGLERRAGTPLGPDNVLTLSWLGSSMAEWEINCPSCNYDNIPALSHDLVNMIGSEYKNASESKPGTICAKCRYPINPRTGRWVHGQPHLRFDNPGYHVPQILMPLHYAEPRKWKALVGKMNGAANTPLYMFYNEVCGEAFDSGSRLITVADLKRAACLGQPNSHKEALKHLDSYSLRILAVDWGGAGQDNTSFTSYAVLGWEPSGKIDVIWGHRSLMTTEHVEEAKLALNIMRTFRCSHLAHDYSGAGSLRETLITQSGVPYECIIPIAYVRAASGNIFQFKEATVRHPRNYYQMDKTRALLLTCQQIKNGHLRFFDYDFKGPDDPGLLHDFLALVENKVDSRLGGKTVYTIDRNPRMPDDFAQAVAMGCCGLWHIQQEWPNLAVQENVYITPEMQQLVSPNEPTWEDPMMDRYG